MGCHHIFSASYCKTIKVAISNMRSMLIAVPSVPISYSMCKSKVNHRLQEKVIRQVAQLTIRCKNYIENVIVSLNAGCCQ